MLVVLVFKLCFSPLFNKSISSVVKLMFVVLTVRVWNLCAGSGIDSIAVSYTHLDVYKRQHLQCWTRDFTVRFGVIGIVTSGLMCFVLHSVKLQ